MGLEINGEIIEDDLINEELEYIIKGQKQLLTLEERDALLQSVKEGLIYKTILRQEVERLEMIIPDETIDREYLLFFSKKTLPGEEKEVKKYIKGKLKESHYIDQVCQDLIPPQISHLRTFYEDNKEHYFISKEFQYLEIGFHYPRPEFHIQIYEDLTYIRNQLSKTAPTDLSRFINSDDGEKIIFLKMAKSEFQSYFFSQKWKTPIGELTRKGLEFFESLTKTGISQVTDSSGESLYFTPLKVKKLAENQKNKSYHYLGLFLHIQNRNDFIPNFEEIIKKVRSDLWEEMRQIKMKAHLRRLIEKSTIRDINYI